MAYNETPMKGLAMFKNLTDKQKAIIALSAHIIVPVVVTIAGCMIEKKLSNKE